MYGGIKYVIYFLPLLYEKYFIFARIYASNLRWSGGKKWMYVFMYSAGYYCPI